MNQLIEMLQERMRRIQDGEFLTAVLSAVEMLDRNIHDDCYNSDQIEELVREGVEESEREKAKELSRIKPEEHRKRFGVIKNQDSA